MKTLSIIKKMICAAALISTTLSAYAGCNDVIPNINWKGCDKSNQLIQNIDFSNSRLYKTNFRNTIFNNAKFDEADASGSDFSGAVLGNVFHPGTSASFSDTHLSGAKFNFSTCEGCIFNGSYTASGGKAAQVIFDYVEYDNVKFFYVIFPYASFKYANLNAQFQYAILNNVTFSHANITAPDLHGMHGDGVDASQLNNASFIDSKINSVIFTNSQLAQADFTNATLNKVRFLNCNLTNSDFSGFKVLTKNVLFKGSNLRGAKFTEKWSVLKRKIDYDDKTDFTGAQMGGVTCKAGSIGECIL